MPVTRNFSSLSPFHVSYYKKRVMQYLVFKEKLYNNPPRAITTQEIWHTRICKDTVSVKCHKTHWPIGTSSLISNHFLHTYEVLAVLMREHRVDSRCLEYLEGFLWVCLGVCLGMCVWVCECVCICVCECVYECVSESVDVSSEWR